jgi:hypothetical protein
MSETARYLKLGHLVCDDASGNNLIRDDASNNNLVFADTAIATFTRNPDGDKGYSKLGNDADYATALAEMQGASWSGNNQSEQVPSVFWPGSYTIAARCLGWQMLGTRYIKSITFDVTVLTNSPTWRVGWRQGGADPDPDWTWVSGASAITGTGTGVQTLTVDSVCADWLWLIATLDPYPNTTTFTAAEIQFSPATITV